MTFSSMAAMFAIMVVLAAIPSVSVLLVTSRSATAGFVHGVFASIGIVIGDIIFILFAIFGLTLLAKMLGDLFTLARYIGGAYLIWLGIKLWQAKSKIVTKKDAETHSLFGSFLAGLLITLGDQKAILFYLGFFPAFLDLSRLSYFDTGIIISITIIAVGGVKIAYAYMADRTSQLLNNPAVTSGLHVTAAAVLTGVGLFLLAST